MLTVSRKELELARVADCYSMRLPPGVVIFPDRAEATDGHIAIRMYVTLIPAEDAPTPARVAR